MPFIFGERPLRKLHVSFYIALELCSFSVFDRIILAWPLYEFPRFFFFVAPTTSFIAHRSGGLIAIRAFNLLHIGIFCGYAGIRRRCNVAYSFVAGECHTGLFFFASWRLRLCPRWIRKS